MGLLIREIRRECLDCFKLTDDRKAMVTPTTLCKHGEQQKQQKATSSSTSDSASLKLDCQRSERRHLGIFCLQLPMLVENLLFKVVCENPSQSGRFPQWERQGTFALPATSCSLSVIMYYFCLTLALDSDHDAWT